MMMKNTCLILVYETKKEANHLHLAPDRWPRQHLITHFSQAGCSSWRTTNSVKALTATGCWFAGLPTAASSLEDKKITVITAEFLIFLGASRSRTPPAAKRLVGFCGAKPPEVDDTCVKICFLSRFWQACMTIRISSIWNGRKINLEAEKWYCTARNNACPIGHKKWAGDCSLCPMQAPWPMQGWTFSPPRGEKFYGLAVIVSVSNFLSVPRRFHIPFMSRFTRVWQVGLLNAC